MQQEEAFNLLKMGKNIFLTGAAGAGKTYLLNKYINYLKDSGVRVAVTASTGIAATHLQGITLHSWSGIGVKDHLTKKDLENLKTNKRITNNYKKTKVLIIDEISMLHGYQLEMVEKIARYIKDSSEPFGGMQIVLCGDFFQLPPVSSDPLKKETLFAFESTAWLESDFHVCYLSEQHRQGNDPLLTILNDIRNGTAGEHTKVPLRTRYKKEPEGAVKATKLYSRNINVDAINERELALIDAKEKTYAMTGSGHSKLVEGLKRSCLAHELLKLKIGAEVMFIKNDILGAYVNGTRCVVIGFDKGEESSPIVRTYDNRTLIVHEEEWKFEDNGKVHATISQIPLRLAWAVTIHKSQGMTLDAAEIDLGDAFEPGMGYVALSRVRSLSGLKLMNLNEMALKVHPKILEHDKILRENSAVSAEYLRSLTARELTKIHEKTIVERFDGSINKSTNRKRKPQNKKLFSHIQTLEMLEKKVPINVIAEKSGLSTGTIIRHIEKLLGLNMVDIECLIYLKDLIPINDFETIAGAFEDSVDGKLKPVFEKFSEKYSYAWIQIVRLFVW